MSELRDEYSEFFCRAFSDECGKVKPFDYQRRLALENLPLDVGAFYPLPAATLSVPTGLGKTAAVVLAWLWKRRKEGDEVRKRTPRRLVYCLPMRVLVEQTRDNAIRWLNNLGLLGGTAEFERSDGALRLRRYTPSFAELGKTTVHVLMGGEDRDDWDIYPERDAIIIGTQDMLLSRALNRGYAASRSRWPIQFGLLNTDCLWVFDEIQLMGAGLATTAQLEAFRRSLPSSNAEQATNGNGCGSIWMSATIQREWLKTVDFADFLGRTPEHKFDFEKEIKSGGLNEETRETLEQRWNATKALSKAEAIMGDAAGLAREVQKWHRPGTRTIVVMNTVKRAGDLFDALNIDESVAPKKKTTRKSAKEIKESEDPAKAPKPRIVLLHSRFRAADRKNRVEEALSNIKPDEPGTIVVSTQVIEAGVDVSATTLFTELAPWASLIQRFGRCNRRGDPKENSEASVHWIDLPTKKSDAEKLALPYELHELVAAAQYLKELTDVGLKSLPEVPLPFEHNQVIRRKDLIDLFDTTPDLAGNDIDIDRFVREIEDSDVQVFWRAWDQSEYESPPEDEPAAGRDELCPAPVGEFREFTKKHPGKVWRWSFLDKKWERSDPDNITPGQVFLVHSEAGSYSPERGWDPESEYVDPIAVAKADSPDATDAEPLSRIGVWQTIGEHTSEVCAELEDILNALHLTAVELVDALRDAARWHDRGKAHHVFQNAIDDGQLVDRNGRTIWRRERPENWRGCRLVAKAPDKFWRPYDWVPTEGRKHFRHELASALALLLCPDEIIPEARRDLVAYLVAAHHGKVRLSIRSLPNEPMPSGDVRFARGVWDHDELPATDLGDGLIAPAVTLSLEPMELGLGENEPFTGQPSWAERMIRLRHQLGPFRLGFMEAILRAADMRASGAAVRREADRKKADVLNQER
jgi:CRISPR-associated endonuclease/helicase Cas3